MSIGARVLQWWDGNGAAQSMLDQDSGALLMERATGSKHLLHMAREGEDDAATNCICHTIEQLHSRDPRHHLKNC
jgi:streptomycin 6-kinase